MGRRFSSEEELEQMISQLPSIIDKRSKQETYEQIQIKLKERQKPNKSHRRRWIPLVTTAVAILLFVVIAPSMLNQEQLGEQSKEALEISMSANDHDESFNGVMSAIPEEMEVNGTKNFATFRSEQTITVPYADENVEFIVPLSFELNNTDDPIERMEYYLNADSNDFLNSNSSTIFKGVELREENDKLLLIVPEGAFAGGSTGVTLFLEGVQVILDSLGYEEVSLQSNGQPFVKLEQYGEIGEITNERQTGGYFRSSNKKQLLIPGELSYFNRVDVKERSFESVLHEMEMPQDVEGVESPFPFGVSIENLSIEANEASIALKGEEKLINNEESQQFIEAILLTAKQFDIDFVTFTGVDVQIGPYHLAEPLQTNIVPNLVKPSS